MRKAGTPLRDIAVQFELSKSGLHRHKATCVPKALACLHASQPDFATDMQLVEMAVSAIARGGDAVTRFGFPDHRIRLKAADLALRLLGALPQGPRAR